jgi:hypothetical protein
MGLSISPFDSFIAFLGTGLFTLLILFFSFSYLSFSDSQTFKNRKCIFLTRQYSPGGKSSSSFWF